MCKLKNMEELIDYMRRKWSEDLICTTFEDNMENCIDYENALDKNILPYDWYEKYGNNEAEVDTIFDIYSDVLDYSIDNNIYIDSESSIKILKEIEDISGLKI